jgi:hypothetical protein
MNPSIQLKRVTSIFVIAVLIVCLGLSPKVHAVSPPPDGGYPGGNTAEGQNALFSRTTGGFNTAVGYFSLRSDTTNSFNTAVGAGALLANTADSNTAVGAGALLSNTTGSVNTAYGAFALFHNTTGGGHTAVGYNALAATNASDFLEGNTAVGSSALADDTDGNANTAIGFAALLSNTSGGNDTAIGNLALGSNTTGIQNTAIGSSALPNITTGRNNVALGFEAGTSVSTAHNVICIGAGNSGADVSNTTWIDSIYGVTTQNGTTAPVIVSANGQLGTVASSERFKKDIATMEQASEAILSLRPVTFHYKSDAKGTPQFGLVAEEVARVNPALVLPDKEGKPYTVRYDAVNAMLLNEFLKEHRKVEEQQATIAELKLTVARQQTGFESKLAKQEEQIEALTAGLQKVSAQLEVSKPAPQMALNNQ